jgi:predicted acetyltransferase
MAFDFGPCHPDDLSAIARIIALSFAGTLERSETWLREAGGTGLEHVRVLKEDGTPRACLLRIPMGQWFGGRRIPIVGVAAVGVAPETRGRGSANRLMTEALLEMHAEGTPVSGLYASTQPLYRRLGYEQAGHRFEIRLPTAALTVRERTLAMRELTEADETAVAACYRRFASCFDGPLDRSSYIWGRIRDQRGTRYTGFGVIAETGEVEGYAYLHVARKPDRGRHEVFISDLAFTTPQSGRRLLSFLADFGSMADEFILFGGPMHPALFLLSEQRFRIELRDHWLLRIVDVRSALEARGYSPGFTATIALEIQDALLKQNQGRWLLHIENGAARVEALRQRSADVIGLDISALAPLFSGFLSATQLRLLGRLEGSDQVVRACDAAFAGTTPWMSDMY